MRRYWVVLGCGLVFWLAADRAAEAFALGIPLDGFIGTLTTSVTGLGFLVGLVGGVGMIAAKMENAYGQFFSGFTGYFINAGMLGGLTTILGLLGLVQGAVLP